LPFATAQLHKRTLGKLPDADAIEGHLDGVDVCRGQAAKQADVTRPSHPDDISYSKWQGELGRLRDIARCRDGADRPFIGSE
jgi:hypothetical protein